MSLHSRISSLSGRVALGWASPGEMAELDRLNHEVEENQRIYAETMEAWARREARQPKPARWPDWMKAMGPDDYIRNRRVVSERESFEEQQERLRYVNPSCAG